MCWIYILWKIRCQNFKIYNECMAGWQELPPSDIHFLYKIDTLKACFSKITPKCSENTKFAKFFWFMELIILFVGSCVIYTHLYKFAKEAKNVNKDPLISTCFVHCRVPLVIPLELFLCSSHKTFGQIFSKYCICLLSKCAMNLSILDCFDSL